MDKNQDHLIVSVKGLWDKWASSSWEEEIEDNMDAYVIDISSDEEYGEWPRVLVQYNFRSSEFYVFSAVTYATS